MKTVTISIPEGLQLFVAEQVTTKGYGNVSEYFRSLVREDQKRAAEERLENLLLEGLESGPSIKADARFWDELREEAKRQVKKRQHG